MKSCLIMEGGNDVWAQLSHMQLLFMQQVSQSTWPRQKRETNIWTNLK